MKEAATKSMRIAGRVVLWLAAVLGTAGLLVVTGGLLPFGMVKQIGDGLSKDGNLELLSAARYAVVRPWLLVGGVTLLLLAGGLVVFRRQAQRGAVSGWQWLVRFSRAAWMDGGALLNLIWEKRPGRLEGITLGVLVGAAIFARLVFINRAAQYDEVYSYLEFARHSFWQVISDYHVPNNHVFNTLLMRVSTLLFGGDLWAIRLPALTAGVLLVIAAYGLGRVVYNRWVGLMAAAGVALVPQLIFYSTSGRGYTFVCLFTVLIFALGALVRKQKNRAAWLLLALCTALGFYSIPVMLYPFGGLWVWLVIRGIVQDYDPAYGTRWGWLRYGLGFSVLSGLFTVLLYLPIFWHHGIFVFASGSSVAASVGWETFLEGLGAVANEVLGSWGFGLPGWVGYAALGGLLLTVVFERRAARHKVSMPLALAGFIVVELLVHRPVTLGRVWLFLLPLVVVWGVAGWFTLADWLMDAVQRAVYGAKATSSVHGSPSGLRKAVYSLALTVLFLLAIGIWSAGFLSPYVSDPDMVKSMWGEDVEQTTLFLKEHIQEGDVVVVDFMIDARYWYYFDRHGIPQERIRAIKSHPFQQVYVVQEPECWWTVDTLLQDFGPDRVFLDMDTLHEVGQVGNTHVYALDANLSAVQKAYGKLPEDWGR